MIRLTRLRLYRHRWQLHEHLAAHPEIGTPCRYSIPSTCTCHRALRRGRLLMFMDAQLAGDPRLSARIIGGRYGGAGNDATR